MLIKENILNIFGLNLDKLELEFSACSPAVEYFPRKSAHLLI